MLMRDSYVNGIKGLKQLYKILIVRNKIGDFGKFIGAFLDRHGYHSWGSR